MADKNQALDFGLYFKENPYTENADNYVKNDNSNNDNNSSNNDKFDAIQSPGYNQELQNNIYGDALRFSDLAASNSNRQIANRENQASNQAAFNYQTKSNIDAQNAGRAAELAKNSGRQSAGTLSSYNDGLTRYDPEIGGSPYNPTVKYVPRQDKDVAMARMNNEMQRNNNYEDYVRSLSKGENDRRNNQILNQQQNEANLRQTAAQGNTQRDVAAIGATGNVLGSLFGSAGSGSPNYKFWN
jgi:hypothetical protein